MAFFNEHDRATPYFKLLLSFGLSLFFIRLLIWTDTFHSSLLYIAWPFGLSMILYYFTPQIDGSTWVRRFWNNLRIGLIFLFGSSLVLMEGYVCVIMFMPIFFISFLFGFISDYFFHRYGKGTMNAHVIPFIVALVSLEGATDVTTFNRYNEVTHTQIIASSVADIKRRIERPAEPKAKRHWMLWLFPMPKKVGSARLDEGETRTYEFEYHRWFATNTHRGNIEVTFAKVADNHFRTTIKDTSYIASYMKLHGTELTLDPINENETRVTLKVAFDRAIDPVWYFEPLQRFVVKKGASYFVKNLLHKPLEQEARSLRSDFEQPHG